MKKHIITVAATKGGTGKSTTAGAVAEAAALDGRRALLIDMDPQANLSFWYNAKPSPNTAYNVFAGGDLSGAVQHTESGLDLIPGSGNIIKTETKSGSARRLEEALQPLKKDYDFIVIDTPPAPGEIMNNGIFAASEILIPLEADILSIQGFYTIMDIIDAARRSKRNLHYLGAVVTRYDRRPIVNRELLEMIQEDAAARHVPFLGTVRKCVKVPEAQAQARPLYQYAPKCNAALDYLEVYQAITRGEK